MARRPRSTRSIFRSGSTPDRRVVESPAIEPRTAAQPGFNDEGGVDSPWGDLAYVVHNPNDAWVPDGLTEDERLRQYVDSLPDDEKMVLPAAWLDRQASAQRMAELNQREAALLQAMAKATLPEQRQLLADLHSIRSEKSARIAASRELDLANATVADHLTPVVAAGVRSTAKSDWLDDVPVVSPGNFGHEMVVEASIFYRNLHTAVKADVHELVAQAEGKARQVASRFDAQAPAARRAFMEEIVRLAQAEPAGEPAEDGAAESSLPVAVNPSDAPETFDQDTLSAADREALHDSQMADSDFAQKYQKSSSVLAAMNATMWARLGSSDPDDERDSDEEFWQSKNDDTKDEDADDTGGDTEEEDEDDDDSPFPKESRRRIAGGPANIKALVRRLNADGPMSSSDYGGDDEHAQYDIGYFGYAEGLERFPGFPYALLAGWDDAEAGAPYGASLPEADLGDFEGSRRRQATRKTASYMEIAGAYGRDYKSLKDAKADWDANKDFQILDVGPNMGRYINKAQLSEMPAGTTLMVRFKGMTEVREIAKSSVRRTAVSLTNVGLDGENGIGTDPQGNRVRFKLSPQDRKDLSAVLFSDMAVNFTGVDVEESDIIRSASRRTASGDYCPKCGSSESTMQASGTQKCNSCGHEHLQYQRTDKKSARRTASVVDTLRQIVEQKQHQKINGQIIDLFSASMILGVLDALNPENQATFTKIIEANPAQAAEVAAKLTNKATAAKTAAEKVRIDGRTTYKWNGLWAADASDNGPEHSINRGYDPNCSWCWLGYGHTEAEHAKKLAEAAPGPSFDDPQFAPGGQGTWSSLRSRKTAGQVLDTCRRIVENQQYEEVNGVALDMFSASGILAVYDALSPENQTAWEQLVESKPLDWVVDKTFSLLNKAKTGAHTAGAPTIKGPDQDLKNAPQAEQDAYWHWVGQMSADSDSGYYVPLNFKAWRSSYWDDSQSNTTYAPGMPPMASSRRTAAHWEYEINGRKVLCLQTTSGKWFAQVDGTQVNGGPFATRGEALEAATASISTSARRRTAADEPSDSGVAESTLPVAINPSDAPEGLDQLTTTPQTGTGMVGEGATPSGGGQSGFAAFVKDHSKAAAFRTRVQGNLEAGRRPFVREAMPSPADMGVKVGDFFYSSWGYDQTNVDFYEVVGLTPGGVKVQRVRSKSVSVGSGSDKVTPAAGEPYGDEGVVTKRLKDVGRPAIAVGYGSLKGSDTSAWLWDGTPKHETSSGWGH